MPKFIGGLHLKENKLTRKKRTEEMPVPKRVILPLRQHIGAPCSPIVKEGDKVKVGQKIADSTDFVSAPIHSPVSGIVIGIVKAPHPTLKECEAILIESDKLMEKDDSTKKRENIETLSKEELRRIIREAGIVGLGGAAFPTHVKLTPPKEKKIDTVILNGAECEPYLTCDHRVMLEHPEKIIKGLQIITKILEPEYCYIGIEDNKENAIAILESKLQDMGLTDKIKVVRLKTRYPQGAEKNLIYSITKRVVPSNGGLPMDVGVVVQNVQTAKAIYDAVYEGKPLIERVITVTGAVKEQKNLLVKIGTPTKDIIEYCKGYTNAIGKIIFGGPMMGIAQKTNNVPIIKGSSGILVQAIVEPEEKETECIRCGRCIDVCPMLLMPTIIAKYSDNENYEKAEEYFALDCYECGCCAYVCPSKIPLVEKIRKAKEEITRKKKERSTK